MQNLPSCVARLGERCQRTGLDLNSAVVKELDERPPDALFHLSHPNLPTFYTYREKDGLFYVVYNFVRGARLDELTLSAAESASVCRQIASGLAELHVEGLYHRRVCAEHIIVNDKKAVLVGFGHSDGSDDFVGLGRCLDASLKEIREKLFSGGYFTMNNVARDLSKYR